MEKTLLLLLFLMIMIGSKAQQAVSCAGESNTVTSGSISWTLGELVTESGLRAEGESTLTQGFQQGSLKITGINDTEANDFNINVLPNPTSSYINLVVKNFKDLDYRIMDLNSKLIASGKVLANETQIDLTNNSSGSYILIISKNNKEIKSYQIIKN
jgi:hypothetical protein